MYAQEEGGAKHERMEKKAQEIYAKLGLTDQQKKQLEDNRQKNRDQKKALFEKMHSLKEALNEELMKPSLDMGKVGEVQAQTKALQAQMSDARVNSVLEVRKILTPEQFVKFSSLMKKHRSESGWGQKKKHRDEE